MSAVLVAALKSLLAVAKTDALTKVLPLLGTLASSIATNPSALNRAAALAQFQVNLLAALPAIEQDLLKEVATLVAQEVASVEPAKAA